jgi:DNA mismatch repair protein MutH
MAVTPPRSERELLQRAGRLAGRTLQQTAADTGLALPGRPRRAKGWIGAIAEACLGASARNLSEPDFRLIGVELKTLPLGSKGRPRESTYVCTVPLTVPGGLSWESSSVRRKLNRVLWLPVEGDPAIPFPQRRFGSAFLWSPDAGQEARLREDWEELMERVVMGELDRISARHGRALQIRPKAANARALGRFHDEDGNPAQTLPRGFYLRACFTTEILQAHLGEA